MTACPRQAVEVQTLERFAEAMGYALELRFVPKDPRGGPVLVARTLEKS